MPSMVLSSFQRTAIVTTASSWLLLLETSSPVIDWTQHIAPLLKHPKYPRRTDFHELVRGISGVDLIHTERAPFALRRPLPRAILARFVVEISAAHEPPRLPQTVPGSPGANARVRSQRDERLPSSSNVMDYSSPRHHVSGPSTVVGSIGLPSRGTTTGRSFLRANSIACSTGSVQPCSARLNVPQ